jgi:hypothetical protein
MAVADTLTYVCQPARIVENFESRLDRGMYSFPCYTVDQEVPHGMSGGPRLLRGSLMRDCQRRSREPDRDRIALAGVPDRIREPKAWRAEQADHV